MYIFKKGITFKKQLQYRFENTLTRGTTAVIIWLAVFTFITASVSGVIITVFKITPVPDIRDFSFIDAFWQSLLHSIDTGAIQNDSGWGFRIVALMITLTGVFIFSALVSALTSGLERSFEKIRKGKSEVLETDFILILGWSPAIFKIIHELVVAHASRKGRHLVILANRDKIEMEDDISLSIRQKEILRCVYSDNPDHRKELCIHCRSGNPLDIDTLKLVHPENAKSIIILPPHDSENGLNGDAFVLKTTLALENQPEAKKLKPHIISILNGAKTREALKHWESGRKAHLKKNNIFIPSNEWLAKITAQTCGQPGYSSVLTEILNYEQSEIYIIPAAVSDKNITIKDHPALKRFAGKDFCEFVYACHNIIPIGIEKKTDKGTELILNPAAKHPAGDERRILRGNDRIIALLWDADDSVLLTDEKTDYDFKCIDTPTARKPVKSILILGWNEKISTICYELCDHLAAGSSITIIFSNPDMEKFAALSDKLKKRINNRHPHIEIICHEGDTTKYEEFDHIKFNEFSSILILGYDMIDIQEKDARTILTLLNLQAVLKNKDINIVAELYDDKNRRIVEISQTCDFIISENIISCLMVQLSQESLLHTIFKELFDASGCEIYIKSLDAYGVDIEKETLFSYQELKKSTLRKNDVLLGYRLQSEKHDHNKNYGVYLVTDMVHINITNVMLSKEDKLIVLSANI